MQVNIQQQLILSNTFLVEKAQQNLQDKPAIYQALSEEALKKKAAEKQRQVPDPNKSDDVMIRERERGSGKEQKERKKREDPPEESQEIEENDHLIDVVV